MLLALLLAITVVAIVLELLFAALTLTGATVSRTPADRNTVDASKPR
ncbi:hypothetical protein NBRC111893_2589 [Lentilactobacillus kosonis]|uniref:Uncharacterized protein n=1 Tax=Lentilactobacillus kosonis TaxID=2810561 RepID=A0A401FQ15_9LACO|nr:hypothetical protein NBRC111893_2589 [Lentilactobacillus kosonis]